MNLLLASITLSIALLAPQPADNPPPQELIEAGHFKRARGVVKPKYEANSGDAELNYLMSVIDEAFGDIDAARGLAERAVALNGREARYHRELGDLYGETAETASLFAKAGWARKFKAEVEAAAALDPKDVDSRFDLLEYDLQAPRLMGGGKDKAAAMADEIARIDSVQGDLAQARLAQDQKDLATEESWYIKAATATPASYQVFTALANFYNESKLNGAASAETYARNAIKLDPSRAAGYSSLASSLARQSRWKDLSDCLASAEKNDGDDLAPYYEAARALLATAATPPFPARNADLSRAENYLRKYLATEPEGGEPTLAHAHWQLGLVFEQQGRKPEARSEIETAVRLKSDLIQAKRDLKRLE